MGTRCQVKVSQSGLDWKEEAMLYHHWDGYPTNMLPLLASAKEKGLEYLKAKAKKYDKKGEPEQWQLGRAGKAASFICAAEPDGFDVENGTKLHGDIEWFYEIKVVNNEESDASKPEWTVDVYKVPKFDADYKDLVLYAKDVPIQWAAVKAKEIEEGKYKVQTKKKAKA